MLANIVSILHVAFITFMLLAPFSPFPTAVWAHAVIVPFLLFHWAVNDDTCFLTLVERKLRGLEHNDLSFFHSLVSPIYKLPNHVVGKGVWVITIALGLISWCRIIHAWRSNRNKKYELPL